MVKMQVFRVGIDQQRGVPFVLLSDEEEKRLLPIWIGPFEANAIATELRGKTFPRPLTHDLLRQVVEALGYRLTQVAVTRLEEGTFYAELTLESDSNTITVDARPSDAIALALRAGATIVVEDDVLRDNQILATEGEEEDAQEMQKFRELLDGLEAEDEPEPGADIDS
jgi:bifunctional DNase/RNase